MPINDKQNGYDKTIETVRKLRIILLPAILGGLLGGWYYQSYPNTIRLVIAIVLMVAGLITGIILLKKRSQRGY
jgi:uncharacterized membrane protein YfcA